MEKLHFASREEPRSLENKLNSIEAPETFLNINHKITDIKRKNPEQHGELHKKSTFVGFNSEANKITLPEPSSEKDILNSIYSLGMYYETLLKQNLQDGVITENMEALNHEGKNQLPDLPEIEYVSKEHFNNSKVLCDEIVMDHPINASPVDWIYYSGENSQENNESPSESKGIIEKSKEKIKKFFTGKKSDDYNLEEILTPKEFEGKFENNYSDYTQGRNFIILNKEKISPKRIIEEYRNSLPNKAAHVISNLNTREDENIGQRAQEGSILRPGRYSKLRDIDYAEFLDSEQKEKIINKMHKKFLENYSTENDKKLNPKGYAGPREFIDGEARSRGLLDQLHTYQVDSIRNMKNFEIARKLDGRSTYSSLTREVFDNFPEREDFILENWKEFEKHLKKVSKSRFAPDIELANPLLTEWQQKFPETKKIVGEGQYEEYLNHGMFGFWNDVLEDNATSPRGRFKKKLSDYPFLGIYLSTDFSKAKTRAAREHNRDLYQKRSFERDDILKKMDNRSFLTTQTHIIDLKNKQYERFRQQIDENLVPNFEGQNFTSIYDPEGSDYGRLTIPPKIRRGFGPNIGPKRPEGYANLDWYIEKNKQLPSWEQKINQMKHSYRRAHKKISKFLQK